MGCVIAPLTFLLFYKAFDIGVPGSAYPAPYATIYRAMAILGVEVGLLKNLTFSTPAPPAALSGQYPSELASGGTVSLFSMLPRLLASSLLHAPAASDCWHSALPEVPQDAPNGLLSACRACRRCRPTA